MVREIEQYARRHVTDVASTASLRVYVSEWENGKRTISDRYAAILRQLMGVTDAELRGAPTVTALPVADGYDELLSRIDLSSSVDESMVQSFNDQTELLRTMDRRMGAASLVDQVAGHLAALEDALSFAVLPHTRRPVALALAGASTMAAWQAIDAGAVERAWRHYELAKRAARDAEAPMYLAHAMAEQAYVLCEAGGRRSVSTWSVTRSGALGKPDHLASGHGCTPPKPRCALTLECRTTVDVLSIRPSRAFRRALSTVTQTC